MLPEITSEELIQALDRCVADVLEQQGIAGPPVDALTLAAGLGMDVAWDAAQPGRARIVRLSRAARGGPQHAVLVRPEPRPERIQWAVAHEIGESLAHRIFAELGMDPLAAPAGAREQVANQVAVRLLLPEAWFAADGAKCNWDLSALKQRYGTASHELIARRMLDFPGGVVITIYDQGQAKFRRASGGRRAGPRRPIEIACRTVVHETSQPARRTDDECIARGWPVHEADWKREILRLEWKDDGEC